MRDIGNCAGTPSYFCKVDLDDPRPRRSELSCQPQTATCMSTKISNHRTAAPDPSWSSCRLSPLPLCPSCKRVSPLGLFTLAAFHHEFRIRLEREGNHEQTSLRPMSEMDCSNSRDVGSGGFLHGRRPIAQRKRLSWSSRADGKEGGLWHRLGVHGTEASKEGGFRQV